MNRYWTVHTWVWSDTGIAYPRRNCFAAGTGAFKSVAKTDKLITGRFLEITPARARELTGCWCYERNSD